MSVAKPKPEGQYMKVNKTKSLSVAKLNELSHEELVHKVQQLEAYNTQLKNLLKKKSEEKFVTPAIDSKLKTKIKSSTTRHVLLKLLYLGWDCQGYVSQDDSVNTIEYYLFRALEKCCLIEKREKCNYQRCGRTDKGVSAFSQVVSLDLKSKYEEPNADNCKDELPYLSLINRLLPENIKCYAWAHVDSQIGARFDCTSRTYRYYFAKGDLNIMLMKEGAKLLIGEHDFRNLCKMDVGNGVTKFVKNVTYADIQPCSDSEENDFKMYKFIITGNGFLWHQIRCIMTVLMLIGKEKESPDIIKELLDVEKNPRKPQYQLSNHIPLTLFDSEYANVDIKWNTNESNFINLIQSLQKQWSFYSVKEVMIKEIIDELTKMNGQTHVTLKTDSIFVQKEQGRYKPLLSRMKCEAWYDRKKSVGEWCERKFSDVLMLKSKFSISYRDTSYPSMSSYSLIYLSLKPDVNTSLEEKIDHYVKRRKLMKKEESDEKVKTDDCPAVGDVEIG